MKKIKLKYGLLLTASLVVSGCALQNPWQGGDLPETTEELLAAEGTWHLIEEKPAPSPLEQHELAKRKVHPGQKSAAHYTQKHQSVRQRADGDVHHRLLVLEREMHALRKDFNQLLPPLKKLILADKELDHALHTMDSDTTGQMVKAANKTVAKKHKPVKAKKKKVRKVSKPRAKGPVIAALRIGEHPGKTRLVMDLGVPGSFTADIDNAEKLLLVDLPNLSWKAAKTRSFKKHPLIASYTADDNGDGGTVLAVELKREARVVKSAALKPNHKHGHRIMIDVAGQ